MMMKMRILVCAEENDFSIPHQTKHHYRTAEHSRSVLG